MREFDQPSKYDGYTDGKVIVGHFMESDTYVTRRPEGMSDWLITFTLGGEGIFITPGGENVCQMGDVTLLKPGTPHQYSTKKGQNWHFVWAHFPSRMIETSLLPNKELIVHQIESESSRKRIYRAFRQVISDSRERNIYWQELCENALREVLLLLAQRMCYQIDPRIEETLHLLSHEMREPVKIDALARTIGLSPSRLSHLFKETTGKSIIEMINQMRVHEAALLLKNTNRNALEVSLDVGFQNYNHFANQFRKIFGVNPSTFKNQRDHD